MFKCLQSTQEHWTRHIVFYKDGHVQHIRYHPMPSVPGYISVAATVLPSIRKDQIYHVFIVITESTAHAITACYACPAGLTGCCNHHIIS